MAPTTEQTAALESLTWFLRFPEVSEVLLYQGCNATRIMSRITTKIPLIIFVILVIIIVILLIILVAYHPCTVCS